MRYGLDPSGYQCWAQQRAELQVLPVEQVAEPLPALETETHLRQNRGAPVKLTHRWLGPDQTLTFIFYINAWQNLSSSGHEGSGLQPQRSRTFLLQTPHQILAWFFPPRIKIIWRVLATFGLCDLPSITPQRLGTLFLNHPAAGRQESALCTVPTCRSHLQALWP